MSAEEKEGKQRNEEIDNQLKKDRMMQRNEIKMLLLGEFHSSRLRCDKRSWHFRRCWWIRKVYDPEADEIDTRRFLQSRWAWIVQRNHLLKYCTVDEGHTRSNGVPGGAAWRWATRVSCSDNIHAAPTNRRRQSPTRSWKCYQGIVARSWGAGVFHEVARVPA